MLLYETTEHLSGEFETTKTSNFQWIIFIHTVYMEDLSENFLLFTNILFMSKSLITPSFTPCFNKPILSPCKDYKSSFQFPWSFLSWRSSQYMQKLSLNKKSSNGTECLNGCKDFEWNLQDLEKFSCLEDDSQVRLECKVSPECNENATEGFTSPAKMTTWTGLHVDNGPENVLEMHFLSFWVFSSMFSPSLIFYPWKLRRK